MDLGACSLRNVSSHLSKKTARWDEGGMEMRFSQAGVPSHLNGLDRLYNIIAVSRPI